TLDQIPKLQSELTAFGRQTFPTGEFRTKRLVFGPGGGAPIQIRISGQNAGELRRLSAEIQTTLAQTSNSLIDIRTNWREQELVLRPIYATERAQTAGISRDDVAQTLQLATDGTVSGVYREGDRQIPIIIRLPKEDHLALTDQIVFSSSTGAAIPIEQVISGMKYEAQNTLIHRRNRVPTITIEADILPGLTAAQVQAEIQSAVEAIDIPLGYGMEWGGEYESSRKAQKALGAQIPVSVLIMILISILLFNALRQPLIIWLLVPMSVNGVVIALLGFNMPFTFTALLGLLSLSGMLIKNGIVLVEEIDLVRETGTPLRDAIVTASTSRLRPVMLAAITTILGMIPLLTDAFFVSMAITIMGGLAFASILTLIAAPVLYDLFFSRDDKALKGAL
ncbi:MAG: efflux RND transporter permease subunit, partial [Halocynthiibacter sp.]